LEVVRSLGGWLPPVDGGLFDFYRASLLAATFTTDERTWPLKTSVAWTVHFPGGSFRASGSVRLARPRGASRLPEYWGTRRPARPRPPGRRAPLRGTLRGPGGRPRSRRGLADGDP